MLRNYPLVSIVMNCYNGEKYLSDSLNSIILQTYSNWEVVFWDNNSTDNSAKILLSYSDNRFKYFKSGSNLNLGLARNMALAKCIGDFICFLDVDDYWEPTKLTDQIEWFNQRPDYSFLYTNFNIIYPTKVIKNALRSIQPDGFVFKNFLENYPVNLQTVMIRSTCFSKLRESFDPILNLAEEFDLFLRLSLIYKVGFLNKSLANYRIHSEMTSISGLNNWPSEIEYILNKFTLESENFSKEYSRSIKKLRVKNAYYRARASVHSVALSQARSQLLPFIFNDLRIFLLYLILRIFGRKGWIFVHQIKGKII